MVLLIHNVYLITYNVKFQQHYIVKYIHFFNHFNLIVFKIQLFKIQFLQVLNHHEKDL